MFLVLSFSCLFLIHCKQVLSREWRCNWSIADRSPVGLLLHLKLLNCRCTPRGQWVEIHIVLSLYIQYLTTGEFDIPLKQCSSPNVYIDGPAQKTEKILIKSNNLCCGFVAIVVSQYIHLDVAVIDLGKSQVQTNHTDISCAYEQQNNKIMRGVVVDMKFKRTKSRSARVLCF